MSAPTGKLKLAYQSLAAAEARETALRDELGETKGEYDRAVNKVDALQQRMTAADERVDVLEGLLRTSLLAMKRIYQAGYDRIIDSGGTCDTPEYMMEHDPTAREIRSALKPADANDDSCEFCKGWGFSSNSDGADEGCGACNGTGKEPEEGGGDE